MNPNMFFSPDNMALAQIKIHEDQIKAQKEQDQNAIQTLNRQKEHIRNCLVQSGKMNLPIRDDIDKPLLCSWFAVNGLTCDKDVFVKYSCGYDTCAWTVSLNPPTTPKTWWKRIFNK